MALTVPHGIYTSRTIGGAAEHIGAAAPASIDDTFKANPPPVADQSPCLLIAATSSHTKYKK